MKRQKQEHWIKPYLLIAIGTTILAIGINMFFAPQELVTGGVNGISIIVKALTKDILDGGVPIWLTNLILNIPLFILGVVVLGRSFGRKTLFATFYLSFALYYTKWLPKGPDDLLLCTVFGAVCLGIGLGLVFNTMASTGGTDLLARIIQKYFKHLSVGNILLFLDGSIILCGMITFGAEKAMYAMIAVFIVSKVIDYLLEGVHFSKAAFIISENGEEIADAIFKEVDRGVTGLKGRGMYTKKSKEVLFCIVSKKQIIELKQVTKRIDPRAFIIVADVREVLGEGFNEHYE